MVTIAGACELFEFLIENGFALTEKNNDLARYESRDLVLLLLRSPYEEAPEVRVLTPEGVELVSPFLALQYFLPDYLKTLDRVDVPVHGSSTAREAEMLKTHIWVLSRRLLQDPGLVRAVKNLDQWGIAELGRGRFPDFREQIEFMRSQAQKSAWAS